ncbi:MAG TPA: hypothetical protein VFG50_06130 [Rhodothermales bacterium]|nr:hypothetical protein [Rhodothermales bacterium]
MRLCLSSDAYPAGGLPELSQAARRRALDGLELRIGAGHRHGVDETLSAITQPGDYAPVTWFLLPKDVSLVTRLIWAGAAYSLGAGLVLQEPVVDLPTGVKVALQHGNDPAEAQRAATWAKRHRAFTCWQVEPVLDANEIQAVLSASGTALAHVRLPGSGPEADLTASPVTGILMGRLALAGYDGTIALAPSPGADPEMWRRWLFETRGWGCGTAAEKQARAEARKGTEARKQMEAL